MIRCGITGFNGNLGKTFLKINSNLSFIKFKGDIRKKSEVEKIEDIEILRFFDLNIKIKMVKLNSNSVAVDEKKDVKKAEKVLLRK